MRSKTKKYIQLTAVAFAINVPTHADAMPVQGCQSSLITINVTTNGPDFATLIPCTLSSATININSATGTVTPSGCLTTSGVALRGQVKIGGNQGAGAPGSVLVTLSSSVVISNAGNNMSVTGLSLNPGSGTTATFPAKASATYDIGGTLNVGTNQPGGTYTGSFNVTATCL